MNKTIITDPLLDKPKLQIYNANTMKKIFNGSIKYDVDYNVTKELVDLEEFKTFLVEQFPDLEKSLQVSEEYFARLENMFYHLIHCGEKPQDFLNKFMMVIDSRVSKVFEDFDKAILNQRSIEYGKISDNYEFHKYRTLLKENIIEISNQLHNDFVLQTTPPGYDKKVIKQIEQIIRTWTFLKGEPAIISQYSQLKYGILLNNICNGDPVTYGDLVEVNLDQIKHNVEDHQFEKTYPVFMHKKDLVVERLHDILKERDEILPEIDAKNIIKSVINRERRKVYREIYDQLMKNCQDLKLKDDLEKDQRGIVDSMNQIKKDFLSLKAEEVYIDIITGRTNVKNIKDMSIHFANTQFFVKLEKFMFQAFNFIEKVKDTLDKITKFKNKEEKYFQDVFGDAIHDAVGIFLKHENEMEVKGRLKGMIHDEFHALKNMLSKSAVEDAMKDENFKSQIEKHLNKNSQNVYLKNVLYGLATDEKEKRKVENDLKKKNKERDQHMQNQMDKINKTILGESDHFNKDLQYFPEKERSKNSIGSKKPAEYEVPNLEQSDLSKGPTSQLDRILSSKKGKRESEIIPPVEVDKNQGRSKKEIEDAKNNKEEELKLEKEKLQLEKQKQQIEKERIKLEQEKIKEKESQKREDEQKERDRQRKVEDALKDRQRRERDEEAARDKQRRDEEAESDRKKREKEREEEAERDRKRREREREEEAERDRKKKEREREEEAERDRKKKEREREEKAERERRQKEREEEDEKERQEKEREERNRKEKLRQDEEKRNKAALEKKAEEERQHAAFLEKMRKEEEDKKNLSPPYNMDFDDDIEEDIPQNNQKGPNQFNPKDKKKYDIDEMEQIESDAHDDISNDSQHMQQKPDTQEATDPLKASSLMRNSYAYMEQDFDMLKATNNYIQKTKFGKQFKQNMQDLDSIDSITLIFEEFLQQRSAYFLDYPDGDNLIQLTLMMLQNSEELEESIQGYIQNLRAVYYEQTADPNFGQSDMTKMYLPMTRANEFGIALIEKNPLKHCVNIFFYQDCPEEEEIQEVFNVFLQNFMSPEFFNCCDVIEDEMSEEGQQLQQYEVNSIKLDDRTMDILNNYPEDSYIPYILLLFCLIYEKDQDQYQSGVNIQVTNETEVRVFYVAQAMKCLYQVLENDQDKLTNHFANMQKKQQSEKDFQVQTITYKQFPEEKFMKDIQSLCAKFQNNKVQKYSLCLIKIMDEEQGEDSEICIYVYVKRIKDKQVELGAIFFKSIQMEEQIIQFLAQSVQNIQDKDVEVKIEVEFSRHYLLYQYNQFSLPLWTHLIQKMNLEPMEALTVMNFSMIPYYTVYSNLE